MVICILEKQNISFVLHSILNLWKDAKFGGLLGFGHWSTMGRCGKKHFLNTIIMQVG